ncbi:hypothetical protein [Streptomyces sp. NPDC052179]|uniref:hypothetical protein n=1 Tax=Streptomyces sp. NPDC052179 TaxID=3155680 RepID=UPI003418ECD1
MICVDCDTSIVGPYVVATVGHSASAARPDANAHPPHSPECRPKTHSKAQLRRLLDGVLREYPVTR